MFSSASGIDKELPLEKHISEDSQRYHEIELRLNKVLVLPVKVSAVDPQLTVVTREGLGLFLETPSSRWSVLKKWQCLTTKLWFLRLVTSQMPGLCVCSSASVCPGSHVLFVTQGRMSMCSSSSVASLCHYRVTSYIDDWLLLSSEGCFGVSGAESPMNSGDFFFWQSLSGVSFVRCLLTIVYSLSRSVYSMYLVPQ